MAYRVSVILLFCIVLVSFGCEDVSDPSPYLDSKVFSLQEKCMTDFSSEKGVCVAILDGEIREKCEEKETACEGKACCVEHFYIRKIKNKPRFIHYNAEYPCYADWLIERYMGDENSPTYHNDIYRAVSMELTSSVIEDIVHISEVLYRPSDQVDGMCRYTIEATIEDLDRGEYTLKLWNPDEQLILSKRFDN